MSILLIGNAISLVGALVMVGIGLLTDKKQILLAQCAQFGIMGIGTFLLGGVTGSVSNIISIARNIFCCVCPVSLPAKLVFIALQLGITLIVKPGGIIGWMPVIAGVLFTWIIDCTDPIYLKLAIMLGQLCWLVYDISLLNIVSAAFDLFTVISNGIGIYRILRGRRKA